MEESIFAKSDKAKAKAKAAKQAKAAKTNEAPAKKSKKGLVIGLIITAVLIIGGLVTFFVVRAISSSPEQIALKTIQNALTPTPVATSGTIEVDFDDPEDYNGIRGITVDLEGQGNLLPYSFSADVNIKADSSASFALQAIIGEDTTIYLKGKDLTNILSLTDLSRSEQRQYSVFLKTFETKWWSLNFSDFYGLYLDQVNSITFGGGYSDTIIRNPMGEFISCGTDLIQAYQDDPSELVELYAEYPFISFEETEGKAKNGGTLYQIKLDTALAADFFEAAAELELLQDFKHCTRYIDFESDLDIDTSEFNLRTMLRQLKQQLGKTTIEVKNYRIVGCTTSFSQDGVNLKATLAFDYDADLDEITAPKDSTNLIKYLQDLFGSGYYLDSYLDY